MLTKDDRPKGAFVAPKTKDPRAIMDAINSHAKLDVTSIASEDERVSEDNPFKYSTGILSLDKYLGIGGLLGGRVVNAHGWEGSGKTLTALSIAANFQKCGKKVAFLDAEGTFSTPMATAVGVDTSNLILVQSTPERILSGEDYFSIMQMLIQSEVELIIADSVPAMVPRSRLEAVIGQGQKATHAVMMAEGLQQVTAQLNAHRKSVVWLINQMRGKPMVMWGSPEDHTGGNALKFYASYSLDINKKGDIIKKVPGSNGRYEDTKIGVTVEATLKKNKTAIIPVNPIQFEVYFRTCTDADGVTYTAGVDIYKDVVECGIMNGVIQQQSSWFTYGELKCNGKDRLIAELRKADPALVDEIRQKVIYGDKKE